MVLYIKAQLELLRDGSKAYANYDDPESVYDAVLQAALCSDFVFLKLDKV